jgi:outer membrane protein assembly factor BamB
VAFRRTFEVDVGAPAGDGLHVRGGVVLATGAAAVVAIERASGRILWRAPGVEHATALHGALLLARGAELEAVAVRTGRRLWSRPLASGAPSSASALAHGPYVLAGAGALTALDPGTGRPLWRFEPPGAARLGAAAFGGIAVAAADTGAVYGVDAVGRVAWRVRLPGPPLHAPVPALGLALVAAATDGAAAAIALDAATGLRRFEAPLDFTPSAPPLAWGRRIAVAGAVAGDPMIAALGADGVAAWTVAPPLASAPAIATAGALLVARDSRGALLAFGRDGTARWSRPAPAGQPAAGGCPPAIARGMVVVAGDGVAALDARTGELLGAVTGVAPARLAVDASLTVTAMDADGLATGWRLATHLSVV